jgi:outer membrane protein OmpA-like peptidoglycan-associated protein
MPLRHASAAIALAFTLALVGACATRVGTVVLLPSQDGGDAALDVRQGDARQTLDKPYAAAELTTRGPRAYESSAQAVGSEFGAALAAQPPRPTRFTLHFVEGTDQLTEPSRAVFESVFAELSRRNVPDILVVGHTDRVGNDAFNDALARQRAESVRVLLIQRGLAADSIVAVGRGRREPVVPTADGVAEPRNRRVEIFVR